MILSNMLYPPIIRTGTRSFPLRPTAVLAALVVPLAFHAVGQADAALQEGAFVTTWTTTSANQAVTIPVGGHTGNYTVDWGDGSAPTTHAADATHRYATPGTHTISITGDFGRFYLPGGGADNAARLTSIEQWGDVPWSTIHVTWNGLDGEIRDYRVSWAKVGDSYLTWTDHTGNAFPTNSSHTITDLEEGAEYKVIVRARYQDGPPGPWSGELTVTVEGTG